MALRSVQSPSLAVQLFGPSASRTTALIRAAWPLAVGLELSRRTEVVALEGGTLRVRVPDARWRKVLHRMQPDLLARLRAVAGDLAPRRLGFMEGPVADPGPAPAPWAPPSVAKLAPSEELEAAALVIEDPETRRRFLEAAGRYLGRAGERKDNRHA